MISSLFVILLDWSYGYKTNFILRSYWSAWEVEGCVLFVEGMREGNVWGSPFFCRGEKKINKTRNGCTRFHFIPWWGWLRDQMRLHGVIWAGDDERIGDMKRHKLCEGMVIHICSFVRVHSISSRRRVYPPLWIPHHKGNSQLLR